MPQLQVINQGKPNQAEENLKTFFSNLGKQYQDKTDRSEIERLFADVSDVNKTRTEIEKSQLSPGRRVEALKTVNEIDQGNTARAKALNKNIAEKSNAYDTELQKKGAAETVELEKKIPGYRNTLADIDEMERLSKKYLSGGKGYVKGALGTQYARELDTLGASSLDPIIKKFNPAGTLPTAKLNWIRDTFAPKAGENPSGRLGKINNLRRFTLQAQKKDQERLALLKQYKGIVPTEIAQRFDEAESAENQALADELSFNLKVKDKKDDEKITGLYDAQTGEELDPIPKLEAIELFKQGVITNVPNG